MRNLVKYSVLILTLTTALHAQMPRIIPENAIIDHNFSPELIWRKDFHEVDAKTFYQSDISFMIADMKYKPGSLKILEFGEGPRSKFQGYDKLYGSGKIWVSFWHYLSSFNLPIWLITNNLHYKFEDRISFAQRIDYKTFVQVGGRNVRNLSSLENDPKFKEVHQQSLRYPNILQHKGIIVIRDHGYQTLNHDNKTCKYCQEMNVFKRKYSNFIFLDDASCVYASNKHIADLLFNNDPELEIYRPKCRTYPKIYTPTLAKTIIDEVGSNIFVIKPLNAARGYGVIMTYKNNLDYTLKIILGQIPIPQKSGNKVAYRYWLRDKNDSFIIESFEESKHLTVDNKTYDPTMRIVFTLHHDQGKMYVSFLGGYWKLPALSLQDPGTLTQKAKSSFTKDHVSSVKISDNDMADAQAMLKNMLPKIYLKMLEAKQADLNFVS